MGNRAEMASETEPVPGPNSTTTGAPSIGTTAASSAATGNELGAIAPMVNGVRRTAFANCQLLFWFDVIASTILRTMRSHIVPRG